MAGAMEDAIEEASADADKVAVTSGCGDGAPSVRTKEQRVKFLHSDGSLVQLI